MQGDASDDAALVTALQTGQAGAAAALYDRFGRDVNRLVARFLGNDEEHDDMVQQVFVAAMASVRSLRDPRALRGWLVTLSVNTVRAELRRRRYRRWVRPEADIHMFTPAHHDDHEARDLLQRTYTILGKLGVDERLAFTLRYVEDYALEDVAAACGCSLATAKRRIRSAEARVRAMAQHEPALATYLKGKRDDGEAS
jgi:RNA polymerase sigma-70 factor (ECF subfamily)